MEEAKLSNGNILKLESGGFGTTHLIEVAPDGTVVFTGQDSPSNFQTKVDARLTALKATDPTIKVIEITSPPPSIVNKRFNFKPGVLEFTPQTTSLPDAVIRQFLYNLSTKEKQSTDPFQDWVDIPNEAFEKTQWNFYVDYDENRGLYDSEGKFLGHITNYTPFGDVLEEAVVVATADTPKENAKSRKKQLEESTNTVKNNTEKPKGLSKFTPIIIQKGKELGVNMAPTLLELAKDLFPEGNPDVCPPEDVLLASLDKLNNMIDALNAQSEQIQKIAELSGTVATALDATKITATVLKFSIPIVSTAAKFVPLIPGAVVSALDDIDWINNTLLYSNDGTPKLPKALAAVGGITASIAIVSVTINRIVTTLERLKAKLEKCLPDQDFATISPAAKEFASLGNSNFEEAQPVSYNGFIMEVETVPFTPTVNRYQAVGYNTYGVPLIKGELSFSPNAQILINELKFIIDRDNLKAY